MARYCTVRGETGLLLGVEFGKINDPWPLVENKAL